MIQTEMSTGETILANIPYSIDEVRSISEMVLFVSPDEDKATKSKATVNRIRFGNFTEHVAVAIIKHCGVITNSKGQTLEVEAEQIPCDGTKDGIEQNAINGDMKMRVRLESGWSDWVYVDIKAGSKISKHSLQRFRKDGYYLMNGFSLSSGHFYYMIKNDDEFQRAVKEYSMNTWIESSEDKHALYDVHFDDTLRLKDYPQLKFFKLLDPTRYEKSLKSFRDILLENGIKSMLLDNVA